MEGERVALFSANHLEPWPFSPDKRSRNTLQRGPENNPFVKCPRRQSMEKLCPRVHLPLEFSEFKPIERVPCCCTNKKPSRRECAGSRRRNDANISIEGSTAAGLKRVCPFGSALPPRARPAHLRRGRPRRRKTRRSRSGFDAEGEEEDDEDQQDEVVRMPGTISPESVFDHPPVQCSSQRDDDGSERGRHHPPFLPKRVCPFPQQRGPCDTRRIRLDEEEFAVALDDGGVELQRMDHDYALMKNNLLLKQLHWVRVLRLQRQRAHDARHRLGADAQKIDCHFVDEDQQRSCELLHRVYVEKLRRKSSLQLHGASDSGQSLCI